MWDFLAFFFFRKPIVSLLFSVTGAVISYLTSANPLAVYFCIFSLVYALVSAVLGETLADRIGAGAAGLLALGGLYYGITLSDISSKLDTIGVVQSQVNEILECLKTDSCSNSAGQVTKP